MIAPLDDEILEMIREINRTKLAEMFREKRIPPITEAGEITPSSVVPAVALNRKGERSIFPMKWGFAQDYAKKLLINARVETAAEKPVFRDAWSQRRCVIPASFYIEWDHDEKKRPGKKYAIRPEQNGVIWLAGLYRMEGQIPAFVIVTRAADETVSWMHDRMPLILQADDAEMWIRHDNDPGMIAGKRLRKMKWEYAG